MPIEIRSGNSRRAHGLSESMLQQVDRGDDAMAPVNLEAERQNCRYRPSGRPCFSTCSFELRIASRFSQSQTSVRLSATAQTASDSASLIRRSAFMISLRFNAYRTA
jgi:hypothetical protein